MVTAVIGIAVFALVVAFIVAVARDPGPAPDDVALAYELAWDHLDFESLWTLSGPELRDGLGRHEFVAAKRVAYAQQPNLGRLARDVAIEDFEGHDTVSTVHSRVDLRDGGAVRNEIQLAKRIGRWVVVGYRLRTDAA